MSHTHVSLWAMSNHRLWIIRTCYRTRLRTTEQTQHATEPTFNMFWSTERRQNKKGQTHKGTNSSNSYNRYTVWHTQQNLKCKTKKQLLSRGNHQHPIGVLHVTRKWIRAWDDDDKVNKDTFSYSHIITVLCENCVWNPRRNLTICDAREPCCNPQQLDQLIWGIYTTPRMSWHEKEKEGAYTSQNDIDRGTEVQISMQNTSYHDHGELKLTFQEVRILGSTKEQLQQQTLIKQQHKGSVHRGLAQITHLQKPKTL